MTKSFIERDHIAFQKQPEKITFVPSQNESFPLHLDLHSSVTSPSPKSVPVPSDPIKSVTSPATKTHVDSSRSTLATMAKVGTPLSDGSCDGNDTPIHLTDAEPDDVS